MPEIIEKRTRHSVTFEKDGKLHFQSILGTTINHASGRVDMTPARRNDGVIDGWEITGADWHYRIGQPAGKGTDGWIGFGGRQGEKWLYFRLARFAYVHWADRAVQQIGGAPDYARANLTRTTGNITVGPVGEEDVVRAQANVEWRNLWTTPGSGEVYVRWVAEGRGLKEEIVLNAAARSWVAANAPPLTPASETYLCMVFQLDASDVTKWRKGGVLQDLNGDFETAGAERIDLENDAGDLLAFMPIDYAFSSDRSTRVPLKKRIWKDADTNTYLVVGAKLTDLAAISGDIIFDPTFQVQPDASAGVDAWLRADDAATNWGTWQGCDLDNSPNWHFVIKFDLTSISATSVTSATLDFTTRGLCASASCNIYSIKSANSGWTESGVRWNNIDGSTAWAGSAGCSTSGTDYDASAVGSWTSAGAAGGGTVDSVSLSTSTILNWIQNPSQNYGMVGIGGGGSGVLYGSSDHGTAAWRPKLTVVYTSGGPAPFFRERLLTGGMPVGIN